MNCNSSSLRVDDLSQKLSLISNEQLEDVPLHNNINHYYSDIMRDKHAWFIRYPRCTIIIIYINIWLIDSNKDVYAYN